MRPEVRGFDGIGSWAYDSRLRRLRSPRRAVKGRSPPSLRRPRARATWRQRLVPRFRENTTTNISLHHVLVEDEVHTLRLTGQDIKQDSVDLEG